MSVLSPLIDTDAYEAGRQHFIRHGMTEPDMETVHKFYGVRKFSLYLMRSEALRRFGKRPQEDIGYPPPDRWDFVSWEKGFCDASEEALSAYQIQKLQPLLDLLHSYADSPS